ncbi:MAG TPA: iron ABC transporter permease [Caulobacteraceae bacterium]|nr:iron ABC transporter permease [Caulobacteraceae bacterium]
MTNTELVILRRREAPSRRTQTISPLRIAAIAAATLAVLPLLAVVWLALTRPASAAIPPELIARYASTTAILALLVAIGATALGAISAWLVVMHRFPGRDLFAWALALPLAAPAFALAYAYADLFDVAGPIRSFSRAALGFDALPFEIRSLPGAALILSCAFYPYVYLTARAAFVSQSVCALEAARTLGASPLEAFRRVALPLARPALAAGAALAVMETLADYGAVSFLGVQTLTTGVVRAWSVYGAPGSAARLALILLFAAAVLLWFERLNRRGEGYGAQSARWRTLTEVPLVGPSRWFATAFCTLLLTVALLLPAGWLAWKAANYTPEFDRILRAGAVSLGLGVAGAVVTVTLAAVIAFGARGQKLAQRIASLGYATPGAVMAVGLLAPAALLWRGGVGTGVALGLALLVFAYAARLMAAALEPIDAGLQRVTPSMDRAARTLGEDETGAVRRVHVPLARGALWTAALLVFVDVMKELPATLILRPFNFDTLAVLADRYAADERLSEAAWPALLIVLAAAPAVVFLSRKVARSRPGAEP